MSSRSALSAAHVSALRMLVSRLPPDEINWALTGSTGHVLQGVPVEAHDIDLQADEAGTRAAADALAAYCVAPPRVREAGEIRSVFGRYAIEGVQVELMGALQKRRADGSWGPPTDPAEHRRFVPLADLAVPVLALDYEATAYAALGRQERAELLRLHGEAARAG